MSGHFTRGKGVDCYRRISAAVALLVGCTVAAAADPSAPRYRFEQPPQPLSESLREIARQTGVSVLFDAAAVSGRMSSSVSGQLSGAEAIARAVDGTGLAAEVMKDGSIVVKPVSSPNAPSPGSATRVPQASTPESPISSASAPLRLAQAESAATGSAEPAPSQQANTEPQQLTKVEITGSRLKRIDAEGPLPVNVYSRQDIDRSGQPTLERFLSSLNEASVSPGEGAQGVTVGQGSVQLRGLPLGSTLVLINGRRVQAVGSSSGNYFNLNLIPMAAVERVEIVPVGSSAIYGGDALAGVVNVILKKSIDGVSMDAHLGSGKGVGDGGFSIATGGNGERGSFLLLGSYNKTTPLTMSERAFFQDANYKRFGGVDARTQGCAPGTVTSTTGANLPGLNSTFAGIPAATSGQPLAISDFVATAGKANLCGVVANGNGWTLVHGSEDLAVHAAGDLRLSNAWSLFGELTFTKDRLSSQENTLQLSSVTVPASNPYNPFGVPVRVTARLGPENGMPGIVRNTDFTRGLAGIRGELSPSWDFEASVSTSIDSGDRILPNNTVNSAARNAALGASTPAAALNPFTTGIAASDDVLRSIWSDTARQNYGRKDLASAFARGSLVDLPAGTLDALVGAEYARDRYESSQPGSGGFNIADSRNASAIYGELRVPLLRSGTSQSDGWSLAALTLAGRRDRYSDFGGANTYQAGIEVRPVKTVLLRGAAASSFKPPTLLQTHITDGSFDSELFGVVDPARGNEPIVGGEILRTTNPNLKPERGRAYSLGAVWEPESGTRLGLTAWKVRINGLISLLDPQVALDNEALFPGFVTRAPSNDGSPGLVTRVLYSEANIGSVDTAGADFEAAQFWKTSAGKWTVAASATRTTKYDVVLAPGAPVDDRLGRRATDFWSPKWKGRVSTGLETSVWSLGITSRYLGAYKDAGTRDRSLGNNWVHDLAASLDLKRLGVALTSVKKATLMLGILNVANRQPEFVETYPYYDVGQADWRGRYLTARLSVDW